MSAAGSNKTQQQHQQPTPPLSDTDFGRETLHLDVLRPVALGLVDDSKVYATVASSNCQTDPRGVYVDLTSSPSETTAKILDSATADGIFENMFGSNDPILDEKVNGQMMERNAVRERFMDYLIGRGYASYAADLYNCFSELVNMMRFSPAFGVDKAEQFRRRMCELVACVGRVTYHVSLCPSPSARYDDHLMEESGDEHNNKRNARVFEKKDRMCYMKTLVTRRRREDNQEMELYVRGRYVQWAVAMTLCVFVGVFNEEKDEEDAVTNEPRERRILAELQSPVNVELAERIENALCTGLLKKKREYYVPASVTQQVVVKTIVAYFDVEFDDDAKISNMRLNQRGLECCMNAFVNRTDANGGKTNTEVRDDETLFYSSLPKLRRLLASKHWKLKEGLVAVLLFSLTQTVPLSAAELVTVFSSSSQSSVPVEDSVRSLHERYFIDSAAVLTEYETRRGVTSDEKLRDVERAAGVHTARCN